MQIISSRLMEACWLAAMAIIPLFFSSSSIQNFEPQKMLVLKAIVSIAAGAWMARRVAEGSGDTGLKIRSLLRKPIVIPVLVLAAVYLLSSGFSVAPILSWWGTYYEAQGTVAFFCYVILFLIVLAELRSPDQLRRLRYVIILASIPVSAYAILQRFGLDPFNWEDSFDGRVGGSMGNPIFLGGYLVMVLPLTVCRTIDGFKLLRSAPGRRPALTLIGTCITASILQFLALLFTESRGPLLGLAAAGYLCLSVLLVRNRSPWQGGYGKIAVALALGIFAPLLAIAGIYASFRFFPRYSFACLAVVLACVCAFYGFLWTSRWGRSWLWLSFFVHPLALVLAVAMLIPNLPSVNAGQTAPFGRIVQLSDLGVKHRALLWQTGAQFLQTGPQRMLPDGTRDSFYALRHTLGYGPECAWFVTNTYALPSLTRFHFQESENRMHNETFDNLITIGLAGAIAYLCVLAGGFYYSLRYLGFVFDRHGKIAFVALSCAGITAGCSIPWALGAPQFAGIGVSLGLPAAIFAFVAFNGFRIKAGSETNTWQLFVLGIVGALAAHAIETGVAISVASTRLYFFVYLALVAVCASRSLESQENPEKRDKKKTSQPQASLWLPFAAIASLVLLVLSWSFTFTSGNEGNTVTLFWHSWFGSLSGEQVRMSAALMLVLITICAGAALMASENSHSTKSSSVLRKSVFHFAASLAAVWFIVGLISAFCWTGLDTATPLEYSRHAEARITFFICCLVVLAASAALMLHASEAGKLQVGVLRKREVPAAITLTLCAGLGVWGLALRPAWADIAARTAQIYESAASPSSAAQLYERAAELSPTVIQYRFYLGLVQRAAAGSDPVLLEKARLTFQKAEALNRLDPVVCRTLGTFHTSVAEHSSDPGVQRAELNKAIAYFEKASRLAPNFPNSYNEKARCLSLLGNYGNADAIFQESLQLNPNYWRTYKYIGEMRFRQKNLEAAFESFSKAAVLNPDDLDGPRNLGVVLALLGRTQEAISASLQGLRKAPNDAQLLTNLASWYFKLGDYNSGIGYAKRAYDVSPNGSRGSFDEFRQRLQGGF